MKIALKYGLIVGLAILLLGCPLSTAAIYYDDDKMETVLVEELDIGNGSVLVTSIVKPVKYGFLAAQEGINVRSYAALTGNGSNGIKLVLVATDKVIGSDNMQNGFAKCDGFFGQRTVYEDIIVGDATRRIRYEIIDWQKRILVTIEP